MTVRDLINELLDRDMDAEVSVVATSDEEEVDESNMKVVENGNRYLELHIDAGDYVIVDKDDYNQLKERLEELEES